MLDRLDMKYNAMFIILFSSSFYTPVLRDNKSPQVFIPYQQNLVYTVCIRCLDLRHAPN